MTTPRRTTPLTAARAVFRVLFLTVRAVFAAAVGAAVLGGIPYTLIRFIGWPGPHRVPSLAQLKTDLTSPILGDQFYLNAIAVVLWFLWAMLAVSVLVEVSAQIRRVPAPHLPAMGPAQQLAAVLLMTIGITALLGRTAAPARADTSTAVPKARTAATAPTLISTPTGLHQVATIPARETVHHVVPGDSLYKIAQEDLGDGEQWPALYKLNAGVEQSDGQRLTDANLIQPGWDIHITDQPSAATTTTTSPSNAPAAPSTAPDTSASPSTVPALPAPTAPTSGPRQDAAPPTGSPAPARSTTPAPTHSPSVPAARSGHGRMSGSRAGFSVWVELAAGGAIAASTALALRTAIARRRKLRDLAASPWWPKPGERRTVEVPRMPSALVPARALVLLPADQVTEVPVEDAVGELDEFGAPTLAVAAPAETRVIDAAATETDDRRPAPTAKRTAAEQMMPVEDVRIPVAVTEDGVPVALSELGGLGLSGPGALGATRAIAAAVLATATTGTPGARLLIPAADAALLLDARAEQLPGLCDAAGRIQLADDLAAALAAAGVHAEHRARILAQAGVADLAELSDVYDEDHPEVVLLAVARGELDGDAAARLAEAAAVGVHAVLLGTYPGGTNWRIEADGDIASGASPESAAYAFDLSAPALREAIAVLTGDNTATADPEPVPEAPDPHGELAEPAPYTPDVTDTIDTVDEENAADAEPVDNSPLVETTGPVGADSSDTAQDDIGQESVVPTTDTDHVQAAETGESDPRDEPAAEPGGSHDQAPERHEAAAPSRSHLRPLIVGPATEPALARDEAEPIVAADPIGAILDAYLEAPVRIRILGRMVITTASGPIAAGMRTGAKRIAARLAVHYERGQSGDELAMLWPDLEPKKLAATRKSDMNSLRTSLQRDAGDYAAYLPTVAGRYRLDPAAVGVDLACFTELRTLVARSTDPELRAAACQAALALYDGELLAGNDEEWTIAPRVQARRDALATATLLAQLTEAAGRPEEALGWWERARCIDDNEEVYRQIMKLQARLGRRADVIATRDLLLAKLEPLDHDLAEATLDVLAEALSERPHQTRAA